MKFVSAYTSIALALVFAAAACGSDDRAPGLGPTGTTAATGSSTGGGETTGSTNGAGGATTTGGGSCEIMGDYFNDPPLGFGDAACEACTQAQCCDEYKAFEAANSQDSYENLAGCAVQNCDSCFYPICDAKINGEPIGMVFFSGCANCIGASCCDTMKTCLEDSDCWLCTTGQKDPASAECTENVSFKAHDECTLSNCNTAATCGS